VSNTELGSLTIFLFLLLAAARLCGHLFTRLHQPKVVGEIVAGVLLGPSLVGRLTHLWPTASLSGGTSPSASVLFFLYNFGLLLLMFASGTETKGLFKLFAERRFLIKATFSGKYPDRKEREHPNIFWRYACNRQSSVRMRTG
jgi:Kef-type K+ transport system membrane component KefB